MPGKTGWDYSSGDYAVCFRCKTTRPKKLLIETRVRTEDGSMTGKVLVCVAGAQPGLDPFSGLPRPTDADRGPLDPCEWQLYALQLDGRRALPNEDRRLLLDQILLITNPRLDKLLRSMRSLMAWDRRRDARQKD